METHFYGQTFGNFLRAMEADADRCHATESTDGRDLRDALLMAGSTLLAVVAAMLLALGPGDITALDTANDRPPALVETASPVPVDSGDAAG